MSRLAARALAAAALAVVLLSGNAGSYALWSDASTVPASRITGGELGLVQLPTSVTLDPHIGARVESRDVTGSLTAERLVPGDVLTFTVPVELELAGDSLTAVLALDTSLMFGADAGSERLAALAREATTVQVHCSCGLHPADTPGSAGAWVVSAVHDQQVVTATITTTIPAAPADGRWGTELQGQALRVGTILWTLTQE